MNMKDILSFKRDRDNLKDCIDKFENYLIDHQTCDKNGLGFNLDHRYQALEKHEVSLDSWRGFYGDSSCSNYLCDIHNNNDFWKFFDEYLNIHKKEILNYISNRFNDVIIKNSDIIKEEINKLNDIIKELNK